MVYDSASATYAAVANVVRVLVRDEDGKAAIATKCADFSLLSRSLTAGSCGLWLSGQKNNLVGNDHTRLAGLGYDRAASNLAALKAIQAVIPMTALNDCCSHTLNNVVTEGRLVTPHVDAYLGGVNLAGAVCSRV